MSTSKPDPVAATEYTEEYFLENCGGVEFFKLYGPEILKPSMADALARAEVEPGMKCLDLGCGRGELLHHLRAKGALAVGCDFALPALRVVRKSQPGALVACNDAKGVPFLSATFDRVFLLGVFEHLHDWEQDACLTEMLRVLKPGGRIVLDTCTNRHYYKTLSFEWRKRLAPWLGLREPSPPRTDEDFKLHVNEQTFGSLKKFFSRHRLRAEVFCRPNPKLVLDDLYGPDRPSDFPIRQAKNPRRTLLRWLHALPGLRAALARQFVAVAEKPL